jgi:hypothetical protein
MGLRSTVLSLLTADESLAALGIPETAWYGTFSAQVSATDRCFGILHWTEKSVGMGAVFRQGLEVWLYDREPNFDRIEPILARVKEILEPLAGYATDGTGWITTVEWQGDSPDLDDDVYSAVTRNSAYRITASGN